VTYSAKRPISPGRTSISGGGWGHGTERGREALAFISRPWLADGAKQETTVQVAMPAAAPMEVVDMSTEAPAPSVFRDAILDFRATLRKDDTRFIYDQSKLFRIRRLK
jgi:hypothetical protein